MTGGGWVKSRWFWVKSSTRSVADMMSSFSGKCLWGTRDPGTHGHPGPGTLMAGLGQTSALLVSSPAPQPAPQPLFWVPKIQEKVEVDGSGLLKDLP